LYEPCDTREVTSRTRRARVTAQALIGRPPSELSPPLFNTAPHPSAYRTRLWFSRGLAPHSPPTGHLPSTTTISSCTPPPTGHPTLAAERNRPRCVAVRRRGCGGASAWVWRCIGVGMAVHRRGCGGVWVCGSASAWVWRFVGVCGCGGVWVCGSAWVRQSVCGGACVWGFVGG